MIYQEIWESQICAENRSKPQIFAGHRRKPQIFAETGFSHLLSPFWRAPKLPQKNKIRYKKTTRNVSKKVSAPLMPLKNFSMALLQEFLTAQNLAKNRVLFFHTHREALQGSPQNIFCNDPFPNDPNPERQKTH